MSDRAFVAIVILGSAIVLTLLGWTALSVTAPRSAQHGADGGSDVRLTELAAKIDALGTQLAAGGAAAGPRERTPAAPSPGEILVKWVDKPVPVDPESRAWEEAPTTAVALQRQDQTMPELRAPSVTSVNVQALTDGRTIGWRLSWADATADYHLDTDRFCDAVALQLPLKKNANYKMGDKGFAVQIVQWKAIWQKDIDEHFQDVQDLHPNYWTDLYWFAEGEFPYRVPGAFRRTEALDWFIGYRAGNPMAIFDREQPVQEMIAEGFGTLTNQPDVVTAARGAWADGRWAVTFVRPMATNDGDDYQFAPGTRDTIAFAVWEGAAGNVGGRKMHSQWVAFQVQQ